MRNAVAAVRFVFVLQEQFAPSASLQGSSTGVVRRVEGLRGRNSPFEAREAGVEFISEFPSPELWRGVERDVQ
jgi:hypothetical protein